MENIKIPAILVTIAFFCSCNPNKPAEESVSPNGFWEQIGYGNIIELNDSIIRVFDKTRQYCQLSFEEEILDFGRIKKYSQDTLVIKHGIDDWHFVRLDDLPDLCKQTDSINRDPQLNFQTFWDTFNEHYVSFGIKKIDWEDVHEKYAPRITEETTDLELYTVFWEMISLLNDGHVKIEAPEEIVAAYNEQTETKDSKYSKLDEFQIQEQIAQLYVDSLRNYNAGMVRYGRLKNDIGYIQINLMLMLADYDLPKDLGLREFYGQYWEIAGSQKDEIQREEEVAGINEILDKIILELNGVKACVLDLRFNGGGKDGVAMAILNHFSGTEKVAFTKKARWKDGFTPKQAIKIIPTEAHFSGNVYLLTSHLTASASEIGVLASLADPGFTRVGATTEGIFSSTLDKKLPNGWEYELSNEVYEDLKGNNYENHGIAPDHALNYPKGKDAFFDQLLHDLKNQKDSAIELVLKLEGEE